MGVFFGAVSRAQESDLFYGTGCNPHLGEPRGGLSAYSQTKFEDEPDKFSGPAGIGAISDTDAQPLLMSFHPGHFGFVTAGKVGNAEDLTAQMLSRGMRFTIFSSENAAPAERVALLVNCGKNFVEGIENASWEIKVPCFMLLLTFLLVHYGFPASCHKGKNVEKFRSKRDKAKALCDYGAREMRMRIACLPLLYGCPFVNLTSSKSGIELIACGLIKKFEDDENRKLEKYAETGSPEYEHMARAIAGRLNLSSLKFNALEDLIEAVGLPQSRVRIHCVDGSNRFTLEKENAPE